MTQQEFNNRRQALLAKMAPASAAVIFSAPETTRSADSDYPYRQNSDFWYLTGFNEPEAVLVLIKSDETHNHSVLFNRVRDLTAEIWFGRRLGQDAAPAKLGVDRALPFDEINAMTSDQIGSVARFHLDCLAVPPVLATVAIDSRVEIPVTSQETAKMIKALSSWHGRRAIAQMPFSKHASSVAGRF